MALVLQWGAMLKKLGIESPLQLSITLCVVGLIVVTTLGNSGGAPPVFFAYRTLLLCIAVLCAVASRRSDFRISRALIFSVAILFFLMLISTLRIPGSQVEGLYLWYKYLFFAGAFLGLANYARYQSPSWKAALLGTVVIVGLVYLLPDILTKRDRIAGFSVINEDYFGTFLLICLAISLAVAVFAVDLRWRLLCAMTSGLFAFGIIRTASRGATLAGIAIFIVAATRSRGRIPRQVWLFIGLVGLLAAVVFSRPLISKFLDRNQSDPYNYARTSIWKSSLKVAAQKPLLGIGFGQFVHVSKRFSFPVEGQVARYAKNIGMAHCEYLQHIAELGIPAGLLLFGLLGYLMYSIWKRSEGAWAENRYFYEAAILTAIGVGSHALVDNCWTIPVTASSLVVISLADPLPIHPRTEPRRWRILECAVAAALIAVIYVHSVVILGVGLYYNEIGHQAYERNDLKSAEVFHLKAIKVVPNHPVYLDNLGMVYLQQFSKTPDYRVLDQARIYFSRAIAMSPQSLMPRLHMESALMQSFSRNAIHDMEVHKAILENDTKLLEVDPYLPFARKNLASAYYALGEYDHAFEQLRRTIDYEPNYVPAYLVMGSWYAERGDIQNSQRYTTIGLAIVNKYRNFKPSEVETYERYILGRPDASADPKK